MAWRKAIPLLTEEERSRIRMGWRNPGKPAEGEMEREHEQRVRDRAERAGLPVNSRNVLMEVEKPPKGMVVPKSNRWKRWYPY